MRRVDEPVEPLAPGQPPRAFRWRGRRYVVQSVLTHWVETGAWWTAGTVTAEPAGTAGATEPAEPAVPDAERELWRVEAGARGSTGVLDLCREPVRALGREPAGKPGREPEGWSVRHVYD